MTSRRGFILGIASLIAAPAIVKAESIMRIAALRETFNPAGLPLDYVARLMAAQAEMRINPPIFPAVVTTFDGTYWRDSLGHIMDNPKVVQLGRHLFLAPGVLRRLDHLTPEA
jgi:hypothetical protein